MSINQKYIGITEQVIQFLVTEITLEQGFLNYFMQNLAVLHSKIEKRKKRSFNLTASILLIDFEFHY